MRGAGAAVGVEQRVVAAADVEVLHVGARLHLQDELLRIWSERKPTVVFVTHDLEEAIVLGQKVVLMAPNPGRVQSVLDVNLAYPRERTDHDFSVFRKELFEEFHLVHRQANSGDEYHI